MRLRRLPRIGSGEIIILIVIGLLMLVVVTGHYRTILEWLYRPATAFIAVLMMVEYLLLKGSDRTAIYRRELEAARQKRRDDLLAMRDMETELVELRARLTTVLERPEGEAAAPLREAAETTRRGVESVLARLRERI